MLRTEKNILQGMYERQPSPNRWLVYSYDEIRWLDRKRRREVKRWIVGDDRLQRYSPHEAYAEGQIVINSHGCVMRWITFLEGKGLIKSAAEELMNIRLSLTAEGVETARQCRSGWGRLELLYQERRNGIAGLLITILISAITSLITASLHS